MNTDHEKRKLIENMRYRLGLIDDERRVAKVAERFAYAIRSHYEPVVLTRGFFQALFRKEGKPAQATYELSEEESRLLVSFLEDQAYRRNLHADTLELAVAEDGGRQ